MQTGLAVAVSTSTLHREEALQQATFKPVYYLGNKADFIRPIKAAIDAVDPKKGPVGDVFAGTGSVSAALLNEREVLACDVQEYSRVLCSAILNPMLDGKHVASIAVSLQQGHLKSLFWCLEPLIKWEEDCIASESPQRIAVLLEAPTLAARGTHAGTPEYESAASLAEKRLRELGLWQSPDTTVSRLYGGVYFSFRQAAVLDEALRIANSRDQISARDGLVAVALSTASAMVNTVGKQFAQPIRPRDKNGDVKPGLHRVVMRDRAIDAIQLYNTWLRRYCALPRAPRKATVIRGEFTEALKTRLSVIYADPPYTRDHYSRFYHVLETMCLRDNPSYSTVTKDGEAAVSRGLYRADRYQSDFCVRSQAPAAFDLLFRTAYEQGAALVLSYSPHESGDGTHPRVVSQEQIVSIAQRYYSRVELQLIDGSTHNLMNNSALRLKEREHAELILKCFR